MERSFGKDKIFNTGEHKAQPSTGTTVNTEIDSGILCRSCGAVFADGRWEWHDIPDQTDDGICPACLNREKEKPDGIVELSGVKYARYHDEIIQTIKDAASKQTSADPLERLIKMEEISGGLRVTTTGPFMAVCIGNAVQNIFQGTLSRRCEAGKPDKIIWKGN